MKNLKERNWYRVLEILKEQIDTLVKKSLECRNIENVFLGYICKSCGVVTKVPFICKSKFCNSYRRLCRLKWAKNQKKNMLRVGHRHSVFTMTDNLRNYFYRRRELLKELQDGVYYVIKTILMIALFTSTILRIII